MKVRSKGRSTDQLEEYEAALVALVALLVSPMTVREVREALAVRPAVATVYARLNVLIRRGEVRYQKRHQKIAGKSGHRERVYSSTVECL